MNTNKQKLLSLSQQTIAYAIESSFFTSYPEYFVQTQQPAALTQQIEQNQILDPSIVVIQYSKFSSSTTPKVDSKDNSLNSQKSYESQIRIFFPSKWPIKNLKMHPFSFAEKASFKSLTNRYWYYLDSDLKIQGPFSSIEMDKWYRNNLLPEQLLISFNSLELNSFTTLKDMIHQQKNRKYLKYIHSLKDRSFSLSNIKSLKLSQYSKDISPSTSESSNSHKSLCKHFEFRETSLDFQGLGEFKIIY